MKTSNTTRKIQEIKGIRHSESISDDDLELLNSSIKLSAGLFELQDKQPFVFKLAPHSSMLTVNTMFAAAKVQCDIDNPPQDIEMKLNSNNKLVYRCYHNPAHEWDLEGNLIQ